LGVGVSGNGKNGVRVAVAFGSYRNRSMDCEEFSMTGITIREQAVKSRHNSSQNLVLNWRIFILIFRGKLSVWWSFEQ